MQYDISKRVNKLIENEEIDENIALFGIDNETLSIVATLKSSGIIPKALVRLPHNKASMRVESFAGIKIYNLDDYYNKFGRKNKLLIGKNDWLYWKGWLTDRGFFKNHRAIVGLQIGDDTENKRKGIAGKLMRQKLYQNHLEQKYGSEKVFFCYKDTGLGGVYIIFCLLKQLFQDKFVLIVIKTSMKKIGFMFGMDNVEIISEKDMDDLYSLVRIERELGIKKNFYMFTPIPWNSYDILHSVYGPNLSMKNIYEVYLGKKVDSLQCYVPKVRMVPMVDAFFDDNSLIKGKVVVLSAACSSTVTFDYDFWEKLVKTINDYGYKVIQNRIGNEKVITDAYQIDIDLQDMPTLVEKAGFFIGIRSGLCDIISGTRSKKIILYPKLEIFNFSGTFYEAFSFQKMGFKGDFCEIKCTYSNYEMLIKKIMHELDMNGA